MNYETYADPLAKWRYTDMRNSADILASMGFNPEVLNVLNEDYLARIGFDPQRTNMYNIDPQAANAAGFYVPKKFASRINLATGGVPNSGYGGSVPLPDVPPGDVALLSKSGVASGPADDLTLMHEYRHRGLDNLGRSANGGLKQDGYFNSNQEEAYVHGLGNQFADRPDYMNWNNQMMLHYGVDPKNPPEAFKKQDTEVEALKQKAQAQQFVPKVNTPELVQHMMRNPVGPTVQQVTPQNKVNVQGVSDLGSKQPGFDMADMARKMYPDPEAARNKMVANRSMKQSVDSDGISYYSMGKPAPTMEGPAQVSRFDKTGKRIV